MPDCIIYFLNVEREENYSFTIPSCYFLQDSL